MKKIISYLAKRFDYFVLFICLVCLYAVLQIRLGWFWPVGEIENASAVNSIIEGLSYSYIAAYLFYLLTVSVPSIRRKEKLKKAFRGRVERIGGLIRSVLLEFSRQTTYKADIDDLDNTLNILNSKNWDTVVPSFVQYNNSSITYFQYTNAMIKQIKERVSDFIMCYSADLSEDQIDALETFQNNSFFTMVQSLSTISPIVVNSGAASLNKEFKRMQEQYLALKKQF